MNDARESNLPAVQDQETAIERRQEPEALVASATRAAQCLADVIEHQKLSVNIHGRRYVRVEGWTTLASMMGVVPRERSCERLEDGGYVATVELVKLASGQVLTAASAECGMDEPTWAARPHYARRSMAITRATGKAARIAFSWVMALAGYEATPFEEMDGVIVQAEPPARPAGGAASGNDPRDFTIWFGKNKDTKLRDMNLNSLTWYRGEWLAKKLIENPNDERLRQFKAALDAVIEARTSAVPDGEIPF